jgi:hypothetical protein
MPDTPPNRSLFATGTKCQHHRLDPARQAAAAGRSGSPAAPHAATRAIEIQVAPHAITAADPYPTDLRQARGRIYHDSGAH